MIGDSIMYVFGRQARMLISPRTEAVLQRYARYLLAHPRLVIFGLFFYGSLSPFSNDFIIVGLTMMGYRYWHIIMPLALGNIVFNVSLAYLGFWYFEAAVSWLGL